MTPANQWTAKGTPTRCGEPRGYFLLEYPVAGMTVVEPEPITVALFPDQIDQLEQAAANNQDVDDANELLQLVVADYTGTLDQLQPPQSTDADRIREVLEHQQGLLEDLNEKIDAEGNADLDEVNRLFHDLRNSQDEIVSELEQRVIY